ncbi:uncharacterized protein LOC134183602 [Corticium candelabrum]|uniref:uncharacterized protein LOC134183602 n=1 Tax=Corticium candelabrum TaxID=121492 RepID=UPI002E261250|nr:uncharacterized protein LOC134183602 [Corticium candelabrum]
MSSVAENDKGPIILAGPNVEALDDFRNTLSEVLAQTQEIKERPNDIRVLLGKELLKQNLDSSVKCFLVMPCASRTLIYLEGDRSSMYQELKHMCCDDGQWNYHRVFIVLYRHEEVAQSDLYDYEKIDLWWNPGPQKELEQFAKIGHLISFKSVLNRQQKNTICNFLGLKLRPLESSLKPIQDASEGLSRFQRPLQIFRGFLRVQIRCFPTLQYCATAYFLCSTMMTFSSNSNAAETYSPWSYLLKCCDSVEML